MLDDTVTSLRLVLCPPLAFFGRLYDLYRLRPFFFCFFFNYLNPSLCVNIIESVRLLRRKSFLSRSTVQLRENTCGQKTLFNGALCLKNVCSPPTLFSPTKKKKLIYATRESCLMSTRWMLLQNVQTLALSVFPSLLFTRQETLFFL